jgi:hypothetical protein
MTILTVGTDADAGTAARKIRTIAMAINARAGPCDLLSFIIYIPPNGPFLGDKHDSGLKSI